MYDYIFKTDYNPWVNKEITPIKVLDIAPLIMVTLLPSSPLVGASFEMVNPPPEISLLSL
jgi:hypothetical protein